MANELARNQTPNNWLSSYINIVQEHQKVIYRKKIMEEAKQRAEQGIEEGAIMGSPIYIPGSPEYTASSPVYGSLPIGQQQAMSFGAAAQASAAGLVGTSPIGSPQYGYSSPQYGPSSPQYGVSSPQYSSINSPVVSPVVLTGQPMNVVVPANPLQPVIPAAQGILSVDTQKPKEEGKDEGQGKKTVMVNLGEK